MPRYEFSEGSSNKFWEITLKGNDVITHYGRIGADGQSTTKSFKDAAEAKQAYDKLIAEKTKKGYTLAGGAPAAVAAKSAPPADTLIARLDRWMQKNRPEFYAHLKPGASTQEIEAFEKELGCKLPQTLKDLLLWRNGEDGEGPSERFFENYSLMSLEDIADAWRGMKDIEKPSDFKGQHYWNAGWIPFLENGGGDYLCIDLNGVIGEKGSVIEYWHADDDRSSRFHSLSFMFTVFLGGLEAGKWQLEQDGFLGWDEGTGGGAADDEDDHDEKITGVQTPPKSANKFMAEEFPRMAAALGKILESTNSVQLLFKGCDDQMGVLLIRAFRQMHETLTGWFKLQPEALKKVQSVIVEPGDESKVQLAIKHLHITISGEDAESIEEDIDKEICRCLDLPVLHSLIGSINNYVAEMNEDNRLAVKLEIDWPGFGPILNASTVSKLQQEMERCFLYWLRSHAGNNKDFRHQLRHAVRTVRVQHVSAPGQRKLAADGPDLVYQLCLTKDGGVYAAALEELLPKVVLKMKPLTTVDSAKASPEEKNFEREKPPKRAASLARSIEEDSESLCKSIGSYVEFEIDWSGFASLESFDELSGALQNVCQGLRYACDANPEFKAKVADRLRCVRLRPAATPAEKKISVLGSTLIYRLSPGAENGSYDFRTLQEYFEELIDALKPDAPPCAAVVTELERIESELAGVESNMEKDWDCKVPMTLDRSTVGNNLNLAREIDATVVTKALREFPRNKETKPRMARLLSQIKKFIIHATKEVDGKTCELKGKELIVRLPQMHQNVAYWFRDELSKIEQQEYKQQDAEQKQQFLDSIGPQFRETFKQQQDFVKQSLEMKLEGNVDAMVKIIGSSMEKFSSFGDALSNFLNAFLMGRAEDPKFAKSMEKIKVLRMEGAKDGEKDVSFKDGVVTYRFNITEKKSGGGLTEAQVRSKLKKLLE